MAEAIPFGIAENLILKLGSSAFQRLAMISGVEDEVRRLCNTLATIRAVLVDADEQQENSLLVKNWIKNLKDVVYDIEDILDEFSTKASRTEKYFVARMKNQVSRFFSSSNQLILRDKMGKKVRIIRARLDDIASSMAKFNFTERSNNVRFGSRVREQTHSYVVATNVTGREVEKEELVKLLTCPSDLENVSAIAIVGIGGLGKTTLAKLVYNDERIVRNFELRIWVSVSIEFNAKSVIKSILASSREVVCENLEKAAECSRGLGESEMEQLQIEVRKKLDGKKYLLVMDDVWDENRETWIQLSELLLGGSRGSKIIATTRCQKIAFAMDAECMYMLQGLPEDASWSLFKQMAFKKGQENRQPNLVGIGKNIVKRSYGVPLVIRTLACMLRSIDKESEWLSVQKNEIWQLHDIMKILKLSFDRFPDDLKQCFTYCSLFPKGHEFKIRNLIQLWMAQGFINPLGMAEEQMEEAGIRYVEELLLKSFFQDVERDDNGNPASCKMHDLIHDLACSIAKPECCLANDDGRNISERVRHVSFGENSQNDQIAAFVSFGTYLPSSWTLPPSLLRMKKIRTFLFHPPYHMECKISNEHIFACLMRLRVLDLHSQRIGKLPTAIGELIHLRYLDLSKNLLTTLPSSIGKLQNLQTLKLERCYKFKELPVEVTRIASLRHLEISQCSKLTHMPLGFGKLTSLRTLPRYVLCKRSSVSKCGGLGELKCLNQLRGELCIINLEHVDDTRECEAAKLKDKEHLHSLRLNWNREAECDDADAVMMESLQPHKNLKELHISGYGAIKFPSWMSATNFSLLPNLVTVTIERCPRCQQLPSFGELPFLRVLKLYSLNELNSICHNSNSSSYFSALEELVLFDLPLLSNWPTNEITANPEKEPRQHSNSTHGTQCPPCLSKLIIIDCPELLSLPCPPSLEALVMHNTSEQLRTSLSHVQAAYCQSS